MNDLTQERLKELLYYDPETGVFTRVSSRKGYRKGTTAGFIHMGYIVIVVDRVRHKAHRLAWLYMHGVWPRDELDHINHNRSDNRLANLREAMRVDNTRNVKARVGNKLGIKGVCQKRGKFLAQIHNGSKHVHLGYFSTKEMAAAAYDMAAILYHGKFARTNDLANRRTQ